MLIRK